MDKETEKTLAEYSEKERKQAYDRFNIIRPFIEEDALLTDVARDIKTSYRTLCRWILQYRQKGIAGLIDKKRNDCGQHRIVKDNMQLFIEGLALKKPKMSVASIYRKTLEISEEKNWRKPAYSTVYNIVKNLDPALVTLAQHGDKMYSDKYDLLHKRISNYPNEIWQADHSLLDIWLIDENCKHKRPWLTIIMDDYSRAIAGYYLTFQNPCVENTSLVLHQAIWHKSEAKWHICGIPDIFYTDHGCDFTSIHLEQVSADIKMRLVYSIAGKPRGRGIIERFFSTINQLFLSKLPGYMPKGAYPNNPPKLKLEELNILLTEFLIGDYNQSIHSEIKMAPQDRWENGGFIPRLPDSLEQLDLLLLTEVKSRKVHPDGIHFHNLKYTNINLAAYVGEDVIIRYDPRDMAEIRVFHKNLFLCTAVSHELSGQTITLKDIMKARNQRRKKLKSEIKSRIDVVDLLLEIHEEENIQPAESKTEFSSTNNKKSNLLKRYYNE